MKQRRMGARLLLLAACLWTPLQAPAHAQTLQDEMRTMRAELLELRREVESLKARLREREPAASVPAAGQPQEPTVEEAVPLLRAQVAELAQTKVESNTKHPIRLFGTIVSNTFLNTGEPNWLDIGNVVMPRPANQATGSFTSSLRQSRIGMIIDGPSVGSLRTSGSIALDFFGGIPNFQTGQAMGIPRLLYAYMRLEGERTGLLIGLDNMLLAPKNPTSLAGMAFPILFRSGNLYLRVPQIRLEHRLQAGGAGEFLLAGAFQSQIAGDNPTTAFQFVPPNLGGERSRQPGVQGRLAWRSKPAGPYEEPKVEVGFSGHYGRERLAVGPVPSWASALDFEANGRYVGLAGEYFVGRNIDTFGASLAQVAKSTGGFIEGRLFATRQLHFHGGYGSDRLFDRSLFPATTLSRNSSIFANGIFHFTPEFAGSLEYRRLVTTPARGGDRRNHHFNMTFAFSF